MRKHKMNRFLFMGDTPITRPSTLNLMAQRGLAFFAQIEKKYRVQQAFEKFPLYFLHLPHLSDTAVIEYQLSFKPLFHWTLVTPSLTRSLTPSVTRSLTQLLTRSFNRSTSFTFITHLHEGKREIKSEYTYLIHQSPDGAVERIRADIFNYFSTLSRITRQASAASLNRLITRSLTRSLTPSVTRSLTQLLTRSFIRSTSFIIHLHEEKGKIKKSLTTGSESHFEFPIADTNDTYLIHQSPDGAVERIRADIFNYFSTLNKITQQASTVSINRLITQSLTRSLAPSVTRSLNQLLTRSFIHSTSFITHLHEEKGEIKKSLTTGSESHFEFPIADTNDTYLIHQSPDAAAERIRADIFNYFSTLSRITRQASAASINRLITQSLTRSLTPSVTQSLTQLLTRSFSHTTSIIPHLHKEKKEIKSERIRELEREQERSIEMVTAAGEKTRDWTLQFLTPASESPFTFPIADTNEPYLIHQSPDAAAERIRADIFNYFSTLSRVTSHSSASSINHLITSSLTRFLTPSLTRSLTQSLTRAFNRSTSFITHLHEQEREVKNAGSESPFKFPIADTRGTSFIHQSPDAAAERIRSDIFNYFSTLNKITRQIAADDREQAMPVPYKTPAVGGWHRLPPANSINRLIMLSLTRSLTPPVTRSLTQLLTRTFNRFTTFVTHLHEQEREVKSERTDIFNYFSTLNKITRQIAADDREQAMPVPYKTYAVGGWHCLPPSDILLHQTNLEKTLEIASINRLITPALTQSLTPSITRSFTRLLTRSSSPSTLFITHLHEGNRTGIENRQFETGGPDAIREPMPSDVFNHSSFITHLSHLSPFTLHELTASSSPTSFIPSFTRSSAQSFNHTTAFITYLQKGRREKESRMETAAAAGNETRDSKLEMEKPAPQTFGEAVKEKVPLPEMSGFERERLELRYTSAFYLAGKQDTQVPHTPKKGGPLSMPAKEWLSSSKPSSIENFLRNGGEQAAASRPATAQRIIDLSSLAGEIDSNRRPLIKHAPPAENGLSEERIKKIEQTISTHTKQFETRMKNAVTTSMSSAASGIPSGVSQGMNLSSLTDNIYNLLVERVKRERRMMGY